MRLTQDLNYTNQSFMDEVSSRAALDYKLLSDCRQYLWTRLSFCASQTLFKTSFNISYFLSLLLLCRLSWITYTLWMLLSCFFFSLPLLSLILRVFGSYRNILYIFTIPKIRTFHRASHSNT